jgi:hypothetical protein
MTLDYRLIGPRWLPQAICAGLVVGLLMAVGSSQAEELPMDLQEKMLREQAVDAVKRGEAAALFDAMDEYRRLAQAGATIPPGLFFAEADAARSNGDPVRAERAFGDYFNVASAEGEAFAEAMRAYGEFRKSIPESTWSVLESMTPIPSGMVRSGGTNREVRVAPFSLAQRTVTRAEFDAFLKATQASARQSDPVNADDCSMASADAAEAVNGPPGSGPAVCVTWTEAKAYVAWLSESSGLKFRLPRAVEWEHAASIPAVIQDLAGHQSEWVDDCAVKSSGAADRADTCNKRIAMRTGAVSESPRLPGDARVIRSDGYRANDLAFRVALGPLAPD